MILNKRKLSRGSAYEEAPTPFPPLRSIQPIFPSMRVFSTYIRARDGVRLAADVYLPDPLPAGIHLPTILEQTRYWRSSQLRPPLRWFMPPEGDPFPRYRRSKQLFTSQGYAVVVVDVRGTGASFGVWQYPWEKVTVLDAWDILDWIARQPWSDGQVAGSGISYPGNTAELLLAAGHPALKAVIPQFNHPDPFTDIGFPGGILNERFVRAWGEMDINLDLNRPPAIFGNLFNAFIQGVHPVNELGGRVALKDAVKMHQENGKLHGLPGGIIFRDQVHPVAVYSPDDAALIIYADAIQKAEVPVFGWASWMDAGTAQAALRRYLTYAGPQRAVIGAWNHAGIKTSSPYLAENAPPILPSVVKRQEILTFLDAWLKPGKPKPEENTIFYYTSCAEAWRKTSQWPPAGVQPRTFFFAAGRKLSVEPPVSSGEEVFAVDFRASSGTYNRWWELGVANGRSVNYGDRARQREHVLAFESDPLEQDVEISGTPVLTLYVDSSEPDCAFFAYLEDVQPDGSIFCIGEGQLRAVHRRELPSTSLYYRDQPYHSFRRADALSLQPGEVGRVSFALLPLSVVIRRGHRLRIAIAGHDDGNFERVPAQGQVVWKIQLCREHPSQLVLPMKIL